MSVLRMIKLFGWEHRVRDDVTIKREEELKLIWKSKMLGLVNKITKYVVANLCSGRELIRLLACIVSQFLSFI